MFSCAVNVLYLTERSPIHVNPGILREFLNVGAMCAQVKLNFTLISRGGLPGSRLRDFTEGTEELIVYYFKSCLLDG